MYSPQMNPLSSPVPVQVWEVYSMSRDNFKPTILLLTHSPFP